MKRIFLLLAMVGMTAFQSCSDDDTADQQDTDTIAEVFEINQNTTFNSGNQYTISYNLNPRIYTSDVVLLYRLDGQDSNNNDVWVPLPKTYYSQDGLDEIDYNFDFSVSEIFIYLGFTNAATLTPQFTNNQVFRVVIIPGYFSGSARNSSNTVDFSDYNAVIKAYNLDDSNVKTIGERK